MEAKNTIKLYYVLSTLTGFGIAFIASTYVMFLRANHLGYLECNFVNFTFFATIFLFEVPTGAVADVFGRKVSYVISCFMLGTSLIIYSQATTLPGFIFAEVIGAIAVTFCSGAFEAWLVDRLKHFQAEIPLAGLMARQQQLERASWVVGAVLGAWLADKNLKLPWIIAGAMQFLVGIIAVIFMKEDNFIRKAFSLKEGWDGLKTTTRKSFEYARNDPNVRFVLMVDTLFCLATQGVNMQWQPFFAGLTGGTVSPLGWIFAAIAVAMIVGASFTAKWMKIWKSEQRALIVAQIGVGLGIVLSGVMRNLPLALFFFLLQEGMRGLFYPIKDAYMHDNIPSEERATITSFGSMTRQIGAMIGLAGSGVLAQYGSIPLTWVISGGILFFAAAGLLKKSKT